MAINRINTTLDVAPRPGRAGKQRAPRPSKAEHQARQNHMKVRRRIAGVVGGIGVGVITLSVVHVTDAVAMLTGSHWALAALLAIGIDAGMVASELAELVAHDDGRVRTWARRYVGLAIGLSMLLNAWAFASHADTAVKTVAGVVLGLVIPACVFILGRIAGHLHNEKGGA